MMFYMLLRGKEGEERDDNDCINLKGFTLFLFF